MPPQFLIFFTAHQHCLYPRCSHHDAVQDRDATITNAVRAGFLSSDDDNCDLAHDRMLSTSSPQIRLTDSAFSAPLASIMC
jgi:hypothetical protein